MSETPQRLAILAIGVVDAEGIASTSGVDMTWETAGVDAPGNGRTYRTLSGKQDKTFRRLDRATRALVLASEACGISECLSVEQRDETALVVETSTGCIEADLRYARLLKTGVVHAAIFPYTLPSTCLGDVTLRHGLRGPTMSLSIERGEEGEALREVQRLLVPGGPPFAVVGSTDVLNESLPDAEPVLRAVVCVVAALGASMKPGASIAAWPSEADDPFTALAATCRRIARQTSASTTAG